MVRELNSLENLLCGGFGGIFNVTIGHPFDTIKVRLQSTSKYKGTIDCIRKTIKQEGFRGFYKGVTAPLFGIAPVYAVLFYGYGAGRQIFSAHQEDYQALRVFGAGCFSGILTATVMAPTERIKCLLQIQSEAGEMTYLNARDCAKQLYRQGGLASIFRGLIATGFREIPGNGCYFLTYYALNGIFTPPGESPSLPMAVFGGGMAGITNWLVGIPADVVKSKLQTAPEVRYRGGYRQLIVELFKKEGFLGFYKGFVPIMLRAVPANAGCFLGFEIAANFCRSYDE